MWSSFVVQKRSFAPAGFLLWTLGCSLPDHTLLLPQAKIEAKVYHVRGVLDAHAQKKKKFGQYRGQIHCHIIHSLATTWFSLHTDSTSAPWTVV